MPSQYAALPTADNREEVNFVIEDSDDEHDEQDHQHVEPQDTAPLLGTLSSHLVGEDPDSPPGSPINTRRSLSVSPSAPRLPGAYDYPPPHSPTAYGNTNGVLPDSPPIAGPSRRGVFRRALTAILPSHYSRDRRGGGVGNDGVWGNLSVKPGGPHSEREPENVNPPSYAAAQADAVPPYWETAISGISNALSADGEMVVDGLSTGSLFSFLWNLLVSMSFQAIGFLLTYLLHTTHAAKYGSRAGLGVTLIQYGFSMRSRLDETSDVGVSASGWAGWPLPTDAPPAPVPSFATKEDAAKFYGDVPNATVTPILDYMEDAAKINEALRASATTATEWLSFAMMTFGWFILLTSVLGYWRVKRYERGIRHASEEASISTPHAATAGEVTRERRILANIDAAFSVVSNRVHQGAQRVRHGLGLERTPESR